MKRVIKASSVISDLKIYLASLPEYSEIEYTTNDGITDFGRKLSEAIVEGNDPYAGTQFAYRSEWLYGDDIRSCAFHRFLTDRCVSWQLRK